MSGIETVDIIIVGAGPAGLAAAGAALAADPAISIHVIDSAEQPGGQFWRHRSETAHIDDGRLHHGWREYLGLRAEFDAGLDSGSLTYAPATSVWMVKRTDEAFTLYTAPSHGPGASTRPIVRGRRLILATGAYDRQIPVPGWDLPGVMAAGGVQGFAKQNGQLPGKRFIIAGTGPFLLPVAANVADLGGKVAAVFESSNLRGWLPRAHRAAGVPEKAFEGAGYALTFAKNRIPYRTSTVVTRILGHDRVEAVETARIDHLGRTVAGSERTYDDIDTVGLGWGFTPQLELPVALGVETRVDVDGSLVATVDADQLSSVPGLYLAGELTGIGGASLAVAEGRIAGHAAAEALVASGGNAAAASATGSAPPAITSATGSAGSARTRGSDPLGSERRTVARHRSFAEAMHLAHPVAAGWERRVEDDTVVCRCEEVTAGQIDAARTGMSAVDARTQKGATRAGMGWCQGRVCGFAVTGLSQHETCHMHGSGDANAASAGTEGSEGAGPGTSGSGTSGSAAHVSEIDEAGVSLAQTMKRPVAQPVPLSTFIDL